MFMTTSDRTQKRSQSFRIQDFLRTVVSVMVLPFGLAIYALTGKTYSRTYQSFVWIFCVTRGRSNDLLARFLSWRQPAKEREKVSGVLGILTPQVIDQHVETLRRDGRIVFEGALTADTCSRLHSFACSTSSAVRPMDGESTLTIPSRIVFDEKNPRAIRYDFDTSALLNNVDVQDLMADSSLLEIAEAYLGTQPVVDVLSMWWHTNFHDKPDSEAAQFYHFDLDRIAWLKVFIYLTDVGPNNGPHSFVLGSHKTDAIPWSMLRKGYVRLEDEEVETAFGVDRCLQMTAPRGSIIIEDTRGLHKGNAVTGDPRLVLQLQFSNSLFGGEYPPARINTVHSEALRKALLHRPSVFRAYH